MAVDGTRTVGESQEERSTSDDDGGGRRRVNIHLAAKILTTSFLAYVNRQTILEIFRGKYHVHNILYDDQILRLVDVNFANGSCSLPSGTVETGDGNVKDFQFQGAVIYHISRFRFVKCFKNISGLPAAAKYTRVPCLAATNGSYFSAVCVPEYYYRPQPSCSLVAMALVDYHPDMKFTSYKAVMKLLQAGFDIGCSIECRDCSLAGKSCGVSSWDAT
ncbi:hypothetical protein ACFX11_020876 [Malus domestica]